MKTYKELQKEFDKEVEKLRKNCSHKKLSVWMEEWWAMGHPTGFQVKSCLVCRKIIKRRTKCQKCGKVAEKFFNGDGKKRPIGEFFCEKCNEEKK